MRVYTVKKSRKVWRCHKCGATINVGDSYRWWQHMHSPETRRCWKCGPPRASDLTSSDKLQRVLSAQENVEDVAGQLSQAGDKDTFDSMLEDLKSAVQEAAEEVRSVGEEYSGSADNMEQAFPNGSSVIDEIRDKASTCESWADNLDNAASELESVEVEDCDECDGTGHVDCSTCGGDGQGEPNEPCDGCNGDGQVDCETCDGTGIKLQDALDSVQQIIDDAMSETIG